LLQTCTAGAKPFNQRRLATLRSGRESGLRVEDSLSATRKAKARFASGWTKTLTTALSAVCSDSLPTLDIVRVQDAGLLGKRDSEVLEWAAGENESC